MFDTIEIIAHDIDTWEKHTKTLNNVEKLKNTENVIKESFGDFDVLNGYSFSIFTNLKKNSKNAIIKINIKRREK